MSKKSGVGKSMEADELEMEAKAAFRQAMNAYGVDSSKDGMDADKKIAKKSHKVKWSHLFRESARNKAARHAGMTASARNDFTEPVAAAAAFAPNDEEDVEGTYAAESQLIRLVKHYFDDMDPSHANLTALQARRLLEASAGDLNLAAGYYWDEYFANTAIASKNRADDRKFSGQQRSHHSDKHGSVGPKSGENQLKRIQHQLQEDEVDHDIEVAQGARHRSRPFDEYVSEDRIRTQRRRLDDPLGEAESVDEESIENEVEGNPPAGDDGEVAEDGVRERAIPLDERDADAVHNVAVSVSVSDDEAGVTGIWRLAGRRTSSLEHEARPRRNIPDDDAMSNKEINADGGSCLRRQRSKSEADSANSEDVDEDCLSESDWLLNVDVTSLLAVRIPTELLWGLYKSDGPSTDGGMDTFVAPEDDDVADGDGMQGGKNVSIPEPWLNAGFHMSTCGTGLVTKGPRVDDLSLLQWSQQQIDHRGGTRNPVTPLLLGHGITALLSIVTAMIHTGASVQGNVVDCTSARTQFAYLSEHERIQEFESRLVDALTALIHVALKSSIDRKQRLLEKAKASNKYNNDNDRKKEQMILRKLRLCPTCRWNDDATGELQVPTGKNAGKLVRLKTSFTSVCDLRSYVLSNMRYFTRRGGCALFLETIVTIHGAGSISRMIRKSQHAAGLPKKESTILTSCCCNQQYSQTSRSYVSDVVLDTPLVTNACMSVELLSLLLTGTVHSKLSGWSPGALGFGLLSNASDNVGSYLARPDQPVWIVREDNFYSVLCLDRSKCTDISVSKVDKPGNSFFLVKWNGWFGSEIKSEMRVITARQSWLPPTIAKMQHQLETKQSALKSIVKRRIIKAFNNEVCLDDQDNESHTNIIMKEEMDQVKAHPDDEKYYPGAFKMWRYHVIDPITLDEVQQLSVDWIPFYMLSEHQQRVVETKLTPKFAQILWTRWPNATIDRFMSTTLESSSVD